MFWPFCVPFFEICPTKLPPDTHRCAAQSIGLIAKILFWLLLLILQIVLLVPTNYTIWLSSNVTSKSMGTGTYVRFIGIIVTQMFGLGPIFIAEFIGLFHQPISRTLVYAIAILWPLSHIVNSLLLGARLGPLLFDGEQLRAACLLRCPALAAIFKSSRFSGTTSGTSFEDSFETNRAASNTRKSSTKKEKNAAAGGSSTKVAPLVNKAGPASSKASAFGLRVGKKGALEPISRDSPAPSKSENKSAVESCLVVVVSPR